MKMALETKSLLGRGVCLQGPVIFRDLAGRGELAAGCCHQGSEADDSHLLAAASAREHLHVCDAPVGGDGTAGVEVVAWLT